MTPQMSRAYRDALGKRAVACPHWRWMAGMKVVTTDPSLVAVLQLLRQGLEEDTPDGARVVSNRGGCVTVAWPTGAGDAEGGTLLSDDIPDLSDPATLGCLLALVRAGSPLAYAEHRMGTWTVYEPSYDPRVFNAPCVRSLGSGHTEAEALVAALEGAP